MNHLHISNIGLKQTSEANGKKMKVGQSKQFLKKIKTNLKVDKKLQFQQTVNTSHSLNPFFLSIAL